MRVQEGQLNIPIYTIVFQYNTKNSLSAHYHRSCLSFDLLHWYVDGVIDVFMSSHFSFRKVFTSFTFAFNWSFLGTGLDIASSFLSVLTDFRYYIEVFVGHQTFCPNMKNNLSGWFFLSNFHAVFHIVYLSIREVFYNSMFLKFCSLWHH